MCLKQGIVAQARVADHVVPHKGDLMLFLYGALQSLCVNCHNIHKQQVENRGYSASIGMDGWPTDSNHPVYKSKK